MRRGGYLMKRLLLAAAFAASLCLPVHAQDAGSPEALQAAQELSALITGDTVQQMASGMISQMWPHIEAQFAGKVDPATVADMRTEFEHTLTSYTNEMMKDAPTIYARYFTAGELREMIAFYKSPTGMKALHMNVRWDTARDPTFVYFADANYFVFKYLESTRQTT